MTSLTLRALAASKIPPGTNVNDQTHEVLSNILRETAKENARAVKEFRKVHERTQDVATSYDNLSNFTIKNYDKFYELYEKHCRIFINILDLRDNSIDDPECDYDWSAYCDILQCTYGHKYINSNITVTGIHTMHYDTVGFVLFCKGLLAFSPPIDRIAKPNSVMPSIVQSMISECRRAIQNFQDVCDFWMNMGYDPLMHHRLLVRADKEWQIMIRKKRKLLDHLDQLHDVITNCHKLLY